MTDSIMSFRDRGPWGNSRYRGNCSGYVIASLVEQYMPDAKGIFVDACMGSGTSRDVIADKFPSVRYLGLDLNPKANPEIGSFDFTKDSIRSAVLRTYGEEADICFTHPPYGPMIRYSGNQWGQKADRRDTSQCSIAEFIEKSHFMLWNQRDATKPGGYYATLIGDLRQSGRYYSFQADFINLMPRDELASVIIKAQHNCVSDSRSYRLKHPRIMHEYLLVWEKAKQSLVAVAYRSSVAHKKADMGTWRNLIRFVMMRLGQAPLEVIYNKVAEVAGERVASNPTWKATVRRTLQECARHVERGVWAW